jgi:hypothetical protein
MLDPKRDLGAEPPGEETVAFQLPQLLRQHLLRDARHVPPDFREPPRPAHHPETVAKAAGSVEARDPKPYCK